jgi:hypothetical protein
VGGLVGRRIWWLPADTCAKASSGQLAPAPQTSSYALQADRFGEGSTVGGGYQALSL